MKSQLKAFMFEKYFTFTEPNQPTERGWEKEVVALASGVKKKLLEGHTVKEIMNDEKQVVGSTIHFTDDEVEFTKEEQDFIIKKLLIFVPITTTQYETIEMIKESFKTEKAPTEKAD
jgi:hypothetical protein